MFDFCSIITLDNDIDYVVGATYAFFTAQGGVSANTNVNVQTNTTDSLSFSVGEAISITANQDNFAQGLGNQAGSTTASATLTANNATNQATRYYYLYLDISENEFTHTIDSNTPELLLTIIDPEGNPVTALSGLSYKENVTTNVTDGEAQVISGFDITTQTGLITLAANYEITATETPTIQEWNVTVTFVNLDSDQEGNTDKTFNASLIIREEVLPTTLAEVCPDGGNLVECITELNSLAGDGADGLYYHDGIGTYTNANQEAEDNSYRYSGGDYQVTDKAISEGYLRISSANFSETDSVINLYCEDEKGYIGLTCSETETHYYTTAYDETEHYDTYEEALEQAVLDGYLTKDHVKNFICFGPGAENSTCPEENLYRIIGVFNNQVKLIKYDYADTTLLGTDGDYQGTSESFISGRPQNNTLYRYYWNYSSGSSSTNDWNQSRLNTINLNTNYWNYLTTTWQEKIANTTWKVGGNTYDAIRTVTAKVAFNNEIESPAEATTYQDEIGLMYVSDYMYAADPSGWLNIGYEFGAKNDYQAIKGKNWMYMGAAEWTITPRYEDDDTVFGIVTTGSITRSTVVDISNVRPVFYLNSDVQITGNNTGTKDNPYRLVI